MVVQTLDFIFETPKGTSLHGTASFDVFCVKVGVGPRLCARRKTPKNEIIVETRVIFHPHGEENPGPICTKILHWGDMRDVIILAYIRAIGYGFLAW